MAILYCWSGAAGSGSGADWTNAKTTLTLAFATEAAGDTIYVAHDHAETSASNVAMTSSGTLPLPTKVICVDRGGTVPPVSADRRTTGQVSTSGTANITFAGTTHYDGIIFNAAGNLTTTNTASMSIRFDNCSLRLVGAGSTAKLVWGNSAFAGNYGELNNTTVSFTHASQTIEPNMTMKWRNTASAILGTIPTILFTMANGEAASVECIGVDFSALGSGKTIAGAAGTGIMGSFRFLDCKLDAAVTKASVPVSPGARQIDFIRSGASGNYTINSQRYGGLLTEETTIVRTTGGATDGVTPISWKVVTTANCHYSVPFECPPIAIWNDTTGSAVTATVECIGAAVPNDDEVWLDCQYISDATAPLAGFVNDGKANLIIAAAAQTSSSETWGGSTAAFKLAVTFTPQQKGWIYCRVKCAKASSTFYIDPLITLT